MKPKKVYKNRSGSALQLRVEKRKTFLPLTLAEGRHIDVYTI